MIRLKCWRAASQSCFWSAFWPASQMTWSALLVRVAMSAWPCEQAPAARGRAISPPLARAVDGEVAKAHHGRAEVARVEPAEVLGRELGDAVGRDGLAGRVCAQGQRGGIAVDRRGGGVDDARAAGEAPRLQQALRGQD